VALTTAACSDLFWDSCVFTAFLRNEEHAYDINSISQYLDEVKAGKSKIYTSSIVLAEILPSSLAKSNKGSFQDFVVSLHGSIIIVDASPNVMRIAGELRDLPYRKSNSPGRQLATPDAIMFASCIYLAEAMGVKVDAFHTFDDGRRRGPDGKSVPLLSYHEWCEGFTPDQMRIAKSVIDLNRCRPVHPSPKFPGT
jgi:predicted nucleic acid-binding protein